MSATHSNPCPKCGRTEIHTVCPKLKIYLAARYSRRLELCGYREQLRAMGYTVDAVWLNGEHQISDTGEPIGEHGESLVEDDDVCDRAATMRMKFAEDDLANVQDCDLLIAFTEEPRSGGGRNRGGRHVELGIAIGQGKRIMIVGPRENLFCWLPEIDQCDCWEEARLTLEMLEEKA